MHRSLPFFPALVVSVLIGCGDGSDAVVPDVFLAADEVVPLAEGKPLFVQPEDVETTTEGEPTFAALRCSPKADGTPDFGSDGFPGTADDDCEAVSADEWSVVGQIGFVFVETGFTTVLIPELPSGSTEETGEVVARVGEEEASATVTVRQGREFFVFPENVVLEVGEIETFQGYMVTPNEDGTPNFGPDGEPATDDDDALVPNPRWRVEGGIGVVSPETASSSTEFTATTPGTGSVVALGVFREARTSVTVLGDGGNKLEFIDLFGATVEQVTLFEPSTSTANRIAGQLAAYWAVDEAGDEAVAGVDPGHEATLVESFEDRVIELIPDPYLYRVAADGDAIEVWLTSLGAGGEVLGERPLELAPSGGRLVTDLIVVVPFSSGIPSTHIGGLVFVHGEEGGELTAEEEDFPPATVQVVVEGS